MTCEVCGSEMLVVEDSQFELNYHHCKTCQFIAQDRQQLVSFTEERKEYDRHENSIDNVGYVKFFKDFLEAGLMPYLDGGTGLDFGSGPEPVLSQVVKRDYDMAMDIYDLHYQPIQVYEGKSYDFIVSTEVIEHLKDPLKYFHFFSEHLKSGGILAIMTLFHDEDMTAFMDWWYRRDITHISFFNQVTFEKLADLTGFEIIFCDARRVITFRKK